MPNDVGDTKPPRETSESGRSMFGESARADDGVVLAPPDSESESKSVLEFTIEFKILDYESSSWWNEVCHLILNTF